MIRRAEGEGVSAMIKVRDLALSNPSFVYLDDTIAEARVIARHSRIKGFPVLNRNGSFVGVVDSSLVCRGHVAAHSSIGPYVDSAIRPLNAKDPVSVIEGLSLEATATILPVISEEGNLVGIIPDPVFLKDVLPGIVESLLSVVIEGNLDIADYGMIVIDDEGNIVYFNSNAENILGMKGKEVYGVHINKVVHDSKLSEVVKKGQPQLKRKLQADRITLCSNRFPLYKGSEVIGAVGIFKDITENERLLKNVRNLRAVNLEMTGILESMNDGVIVMDNSGKVIRTNSAYEFLSGLTAIQILGEDVNYLISRGSLPSLVASEVLEKKKHLSLIETVRGRDCLCIANPIVDCEGKLIRIVVVMKDIDHLNELILSLQMTQELASRYFEESETFKERIARQDMVATSLAMKRVLSLAHKVAQVDSNVLITGETGVGKEVVARAIHRCSNRMDGPFIKLNCGAIPEPLLESELFGYESGAFTGAKKEGKPGLIELSDGGTLFLDEISDLPMNLQVKLLRVLQEREVMRLGDTKYKRVDFRLIVASNKDLEDLVKQRLFREDLYYRLNVVPVFIPPLRDRREDIVPLTVFFLNKFNKKYGMAKKLSPEVIQELLEYDWPGNIRALENTIERLVVTSDSNIISINDLREKTPVNGVNKSPSKVLVDVVEETEKKLICEALQQCKTTREMAKILGISQSAVVKKMKRYGIAKLPDANLVEKG
jgi:PAS domain S-box-containing protein